MRVLWLKSGDGIGGQPIVKFPMNSRNRVKRLVQDLAGRNDLWMALYITTKNSTSLYKSRICGFISVPEDATIITNSTPAYNWDNRGDGLAKWDLSIDVNSPWKKIPDDQIQNLNTHIQSIIGKDLWRSMQYGLRAGLLDVQPGTKYRQLGSILSRFLCNNYNNLVDVRDAGDAGIPPGSPRTG